MEKYSFFLRIDENRFLEVYRGSFWGQGDRILDAPRRKIRWVDQPMMDKWIYSIQQLRDDYDTLIQKDREMLQHIYSMNNSVSEKLDSINDIQRDIEDLEEYKEDCLVMLISLSRWWEIDAPLYVGIDVIEPSAEDIIK